MNIQWYPGHMAKAKRLLQQQLTRVDLVIELCDARIPHSSRNPDLDTLIRGKNRVLLLNKADLACANETKSWIDRLKKEDILAKGYDAKKGRAAEIFLLIEKMTEEIVERAAKRGIKKTVRAMVVGVPNVGKSTLINKLHGGAITKVGDKPGVTRANQWVKVTPYLELMDTPGLLWPRFDDKLAAMRLAYIGTIRDDIMDKETLAEQLLSDLLAIVPKEVISRYKLKEEQLAQGHLLEEACLARGWIAKGGVADIDRGSAIVLDEFRSGKLGRITLEKAGRLPQKEGLKLVLRNRE